jgi:hypothetical protein
MALLDADLIGIRKGTNMQDHIPFDTQCGNCPHVALIHAENGKCKLCHCDGFHTTTQAGKRLMNEVTRTPAISMKQNFKMGVSGGLRSVYAR